MKKKGKMRCFDLVVVRWVDTMKVLNEDVFDESVSLDRRIGHMVTIGFLFDESKDVLLLVQEFNDGVPRDWVVIPRCCVTSVLKGSGHLCL